MIKTENEFQEEETIEVKVDLADDVLESPKLEFNSKPIKLKTKTFKKAHKIWVKTKYKINSI